MRLLDLLDRLGRLTAGQLAEMSGHTTGAITTAVDRLEQAGYARRTRDPDDRRHIFVELNDSARQRGHTFSTSRRPLAP